MKKILLSIFTIVLAFSVNAQLVSENFETVTVDQDIALTGWTNYKEVGTRAWIGKSYNNNLYAQFTAYNSTDASNTSWLITPSMNFNNTTSETFSFDVNVGFWKHAGLTIWISTNFDGTNVTSATWTDITSNFTIPTTPTNGYGTLATAGSMDVSSYNSSAVYIAFKYTGNATTETTTFQIDNVVVSGTAGLQEINLLSVYPNPTVDLINLSEKANVKVVTVSGQIVLSANNVDIVDMSNLENGIYFVTLENEKGTKVEKIVKK